MTEEYLEPNTLIIEDTDLSYGWIQLPRKVLLAQNLSRDAKILYAVLLHYGWKERRCFPGYDRLCHDMQASENAVRKYMRELIDVGLLTQERRGQGRTNIYRLPMIRTSRIEVLEPQVSEVPEPQKPYAGVEIPGVKKEEGVDSSNRKVRTQAGSLEDEDAETIRSFIEDFRREFRDRASIPSSTARAANLYQRSSLDLQAFIQKLYEARELTKKHTTNSDHKMAYFFACLEDKLGLRERPPARGSGGNGAPVRRTKAKKPEDAARS